MPLHEAGIGFAWPSREISIKGSQRTLRLLAASEPEAITWARVLERCVEDLSQAQLRATHRAAGFSQGLPPAADSHTQILSLLLPSATPSSRVGGGATAGRPAGASGDVDETLVGRSAAHEEALCILLLTIHTYGTSLSTFADGLAVAYERSPGGARHVAYVLLRWAQLHPSHFGREPSLHALWQRAASDGHLRALGLHTNRADSKAAFGAAARLAGFGDLDQHADRYSTAEDASRPSAHQAGPVRIVAEGHVSSAAAPARQVGASREPTTVLLPADTGVWAPFRRPPPRGGGASSTLVSARAHKGDGGGGVDETALSRLSSWEMRQIISCLATPPNGGGASPPSPSRSSSSQWLTAGDRQGSSVGAPPRSDRSTAAHDAALSRALTAALHRPLPAESARAEQWLAVDAVQLARYLTLADEALYRAVGHTHLLAKVWKSGGGGGGGGGGSKGDVGGGGGGDRDGGGGDGDANSMQPLLQLTQHFNDVANVVASVLVSTEALATRSLLFAHLIQVGLELRRLGNFNSLMAVLAALGSAGVYRLKHARERMGARTNGVWGDLTKLMAHSGSYHEYRIALAAARRTPPFIPYLGIHLTDLTFLGDGNRDVVDGTKHNLSKRQHVHAVLASCLAGRGVRYPFAALPGLARLMDAAPRLSQDEQYKRSLQREPRGAAKDDLV